MKPNLPTMETSAKLRNLPTFGNQNMDLYSDRVLTESLLDVRCEDSFSLDIERDAGKLGIEMVMVSQRSLNEYGKHGDMCYVSKQKFQSLIKKIMENLQSCKNQLNELKKCLFNFNFEGVKKILESHLKNILTVPAFPTKNQKTLEQITVFQLSHTNLSQSQRGRRTNVHFRDSTLPIKKDTIVSTKQSNWQFFENQNNPSRENSILIAEIESKDKEIQLLNQSLEAVKKMCEKKEEYLNQILRVKQLEFQTIVNKMKKSTEVPYQRGTSDFKEVQNNSRIKVKKVSTQYYQPLSSRNQNISEGNFHLDFGCIRTSRNHQNSTRHKKCSSFANSSAVDTHRYQFRQRDQIEKKFQEKFKMHRMKDNKNVDSNFDRVSNKIKNFESSIKKQINGITF